MGLTQRSSRLVYAAVTDTDTNPFNWLYTGYYSMGSKGCWGHHPNMEHPDEFNRAVLTFLAEV
jgi:pimeloyl-ACP methyl ester carboxylesterase